MKRKLITFLLALGMVCTVGAFSACGEGIQGEQGKDGKSAYELYKEKYGYEGTEKDWLADLALGKLTLGEDTPKEEHDYIDGVCSDCGALYGTDGLEFTLVRQNGEYAYAVSGMGVCTERDIVVPFYHNGKPVVGVAVNAFRQDDNDMCPYSIVLPDTVTVIGDGAFFDCDEMTSIQIGKNVRYIGENTFSRCTKLTNINLPDTIAFIGRDAFYNVNLQYNEYNGGYYIGSENTPYLYLAEIDDVSSCIISAQTRFVGEDLLFAYNLENITVEEENTTYKSINGSLYSKDGKMLYCYPKGKTDKEFAIPDGVTSIGNYAFSNCDSLESITIPDSVTSIETGAVNGCSSLTSITFENPLGWYIVGVGTNITLTDTTQNVTYLTDTYCYNKWQRN